MTEESQRIIQLFGGLALFLYGMQQMDSALQQAAGQHLRQFLQRLVRSPLRGIFAGIIVTALIQSSSAVTVMLVGLVSAGLMELRQAIPIIFGANIGTTVTGQLLSFDLGQLRYLVLFVGLFLCFFSKEGRLHAMGDILFGFGLLLEGIQVMSQSMQPLAAHPVLAHWLQQVAQDPWIGLLAGLCMTLTVQSSSATIAILQDLASRSGPDGIYSLLGLQGALPVLLGDNIGTTITAILASLGGNRNAKRLAAAHTIFNISGSVAAMLFLPEFTAAVQWLSPKGAEIAIISRQIANAHTLFNLFCAAAWLPFTTQMEHIVCWLIPDKKRYPPNHSV